MSDPTVVFVIVAKESVLVSISVTFAAIVVVSVSIELKVDSVAAPVGRLIVPEISLMSHVPP